MDEAKADDSLITTKEADEVVGAPTGGIHRFRTPLLIILGALLVAVATLLILLLLSLRGSRTGWESIFPFLDKNPATQSLQTN